MTYLDILDKRRSVYDLSSDLPLTHEQITALVEHVAEASPSAFNMQSAQAVILFGAEHQALWDIVTETLRARVPAEKFAPTQEKLAGFARGAGTVMFFEDDAVVKRMKEQFPTYANAFDMFAAHGLGILQGNVWNAFAVRGMGANLQHYNPLIDEAVRERWQLPETWRLVSQMVFGTPVTLPEPKEKIPGNQRVRVFG